jgi:hypothetical protein
MDGLTLARTTQSAPSVWASGLCPSARYTTDCGDRESRLIAAAIPNTPPAYSGVAMNRISEVATAIPATVEELAAATQHFPTTCNWQPIQRASMDKIIGVGRSAGEIASASAQVLASAQLPSGESIRLKVGVQTFSRRSRRRRDRSIRLMGVQPKSRSHARRPMACRASVWTPATTASSRERSPMSR